MSKANFVKLMNGHTSSFTQNTRTCSLKMLYNFVVAQTNRESNFRYKRTYFRFVNIVFKLKVTVSVILEFFDFTWLFRTCCLSSQEIACFGYEE